MAHSSIVGGSNADRLLNCPGSYQAILALPAVVDVSSEYALEGTAMHDVMANLMCYWLEQQLADLPADLYAQADAMIGETFGDRTLTREHVDTMIIPALNALHALMDVYGAGHNFNVLAIERSVDFPGVPGANGTLDLILGNANCMLHVDWKFGQGVAVKAVYTDAAGDRVNPQLLFYAAGAMASAPGFYKAKKKLVVAIIQPRGDLPLSHTVVTRKEIRWFIEDMHDAVATALDRDPPRRKGEWCRWAPCKINCPLWTAPMLELAAGNDKVMMRAEMVTADPSPYGQYLARAKTLVDHLALFKTELDKQLHAYLEDGGLVPGWRLKLKAKQRQWIDEDEVDETLTELGFMNDEIWRRTLVSFQSADATAKKRGVKIPDQLRQAPATNETTVCRTDDPAPPVVKPLAVEQFRAALAALEKKKKTA